MTGRAAAAVAEREWTEGVRQNMLASGQWVEKEIKDEVATLKTVLDKIKAKYGDKTPKDLSQDSASLVTAAGPLFSFFSGLRSRVEIMMRKDIRAERKLERLFGRHRENQAYASNMVRFDSIIKKQKKIIAELDALVGYWEGVKSSGKLPFWSGYNKKPIAAPLKYIEEQELALVVEIDDIMRSTSTIKMVKA